MGLGSMPDRTQGCHNLAALGYKNFGHKFWWLEINIGQNFMIEYNLESGERDLLDDDIGIRVWDLEIGFG